MRSSLRIFLALAVLGLAACVVKGNGMIAQTDLSSPDIVYSKVVKEPNPLLLGHWRRIPPAEFKRPDKFEYFMVKKNGKYAVYYYWGHGKSFEFKKGWIEFVIEGDSMTCTLDGSKFYVKDGEVFHLWPGREHGTKMQKLD